MIAQTVGRDGSKPMSGCGRFQGNAETQGLGTAVCGGLLKTLDQLASVRLNYPSGSDAVSIGGELYVRQALLSCLRKQHLQGPCCISPPALPRDHRVPNVP
jgi:hypothetical protein